VCLLDYDDKKEKECMKNKNRLVDILKHKAEEGIQIYILVFKEVSLALPLNSIHTKNIFNNLHPNIKVTRHPKNNLDLLWSHHEKIVIIDQKFAFAGGLDLCWGRYDTSEHRLNEEPNEEGVYHWPGIDYSNSRIKDFVNVTKYKHELIDRNKHPRMPWHDVHLFLEGSVVSDLCRHFVERWNFARTTIDNVDLITQDTAQNRIISGKKINFL
jgi:phosphatidylserine/phosphatidylglycerophosphate/cardiolipin synthase-like enzyme